jgi:hypothetical protein
LKTSLKNDLLLQSQAEDRRLLTVNYEKLIVDHEDTEQNSHDIGLNYEDMKSLLDTMTMKYENSQTTLQSHIDAQQRAIDTLQQQNTSLERENLCLQDDKDMLNQQYQRLSEDSHDCLLSLESKNRMLIDRINVLEAKIRSMEPVRVRRCLCILLLYHTYDMIMILFICC